jgi:hypothetical protein
LESVESGREHDVAGRDRDVPGREKLAGDFVLGDGTKLKAASTMRSTVSKLSWNPFADDDATSSDLALVTRENVSLWLIVLRKRCSLSASRIRKSSWETPRFSDGTPSCVLSEATSAFMISTFVFNLAFCCSLFRNASLSDASLSMSSSVESLSGEAHRCKPNRFCPADGFGGSLTAAGLKLPI